MRHMEKTSIALLFIIAVLVLSVLSSCSSGNNGTNNDSITDRDILLSDRAKELQVVMSGNVSTLHSVKSHQAAQVSYAEEHLTARIQLSVYPKSGFQEMLHAVLAGDVVPDLIAMDDPNSFAKYVKEEYLLPLNDLLEQHGSDLLQLLPKEAWERVTVHGKIYAVPSLSLFSADEMVFIRKDWLDTLGLTPPATLEDYFETMYAFTYNDPNRNGLNDTWGLTIMPQQLARSAPFFGAFGVSRSMNTLNQWQDRNGQLIYSSLLPETGEALRYFAKLYGSGVLDREFALNKYGSYKDKIVSGQVGIFVASLTDAKQILQESKEKNTQANWIRLEFPQGKDGRAGTAELDLLQSYSVIPVNSPNATEAIKLLNFVASEGLEHLKYGFPSSNDQEEQIEQKEDPDYGRLLSSLADVNGEEMRKKMLNEVDPSGQLVANEAYVLEHVIRSDFHGPPTRSMSKYAEKLMKMEEEAFIKIIMGIEPAKDFEDFVKNWMRDGGWEINNEVNGWYRDSAIEAGE